MKYMLGALAAAALLVGVSASQPAEARCFWNGFAWECFHHSHWGGGPWAWHHPHWHHYGWYR